jgi:hypothetical protein
MTSRRDLGPILAIAGLIVVAGAVIAGFIAVGGPGDARARRFDDRTMQKISGVASMAQCSYTRTGAAPKTLDEVKSIDARPLSVPLSECTYVDPILLKDLDGIDYAPVDTNHIRVCADFRRPTDKRRPGYPTWQGEFSAFNEDRPQAGRHCFEIPLVERRSPP